MPSPSHQDFRLLFGNHPEVAVELARRAGAPLGRQFDRYELVDAEIDDPLRPGNTLRADLPIVCHRRGNPHRGLIFEVQLGDDPDKEWSTVLYRAGLCYRIRRPAWAVMWIPDAAVREPMRTRGFLLEPELRPKFVTP